MFIVPAAHAQVVTPHQGPAVTAPAPDAVYKPSVGERSSASLGASVARAVALSFVTVRAGDTLSGIAAGRCHDAGDWTGIAAANKSQVKDPNLIFPRERLVLSCSAAAVADPPKAAPKADPPKAGTYGHPYKCGDGDGDGWDTACSAPQRHALRRHHASVRVAAYNASGMYSFAGLERLWVSAGGPAWAESAAASVAECESGGRVSAYNPSGATGLWQILGAVVGGDLNNPYVNAENAVSKFRASGDTWAQWVCKP